MRFSRPSNPRRLPSLASPSSPCRPGAVDRAHAVRASIGSPGSENSPSKSDLSAEQLEIIGKLLVLYAKTNHSPLSLGSKADVGRVSKRKDLLGWIQLIERRGPRGWSLVIMPQEIRMDNVHGPLHTHPPQGFGKPEPMAERRLESIREIVRRHVERRNVIFR